MLQPVHVPLTADNAPVAVMLTSLAVRRIGGVEAIVVLHLADGGREAISASQARKLAADIRDRPSGHIPAMAAWADNLDEGAEAAERQASAVLLGCRTMHGVASPREFRGVR